MPHALHQVQMLRNRGEDGGDLGLCFIQHQIGSGSWRFVPLRPGLLGGSTQRFLSLPEKRFVGSRTHSRAKFDIYICVSPPFWRNLHLFLHSGTHN